ncbi:MAG: hypothetical protein AB1468_06625 [Candidatus Micrarchaeota archaeon]
MAKSETGAYFILSFDIPRELGSERVKVYRMLRDKNIPKIQGSLYGLPATSENEIAVRQAADEIKKVGGSPLVFHATLWDGEETRGLVDVDRLFGKTLDERYRKLSERAREASKSIKKGMDVKTASGVAEELSKIADEFEQVKLRDNRDTISNMRSKLESELAVASEELHVFQKSVEKATSTPEKQQES